MNYQVPQIFTPESIAQQFNLRKCGGQFQGPCFLCGGRDRLWTTRGRNGQTLVRCRHCGDAPFKALTERSSQGHVPAKVIQQSVNCSVTEPPSRTQEVARQRWKYAIDIEPFSEHPYARKKGITHRFGARRSLVMGDDVIQVPNRNWDEEIVGVEYIYPDGSKKTWGKKGFLLLGNERDPLAIIHVCEGWATAWSIHQEFNRLTQRPHAVIAAFGKNLEKVGRETQQRFSQPTYIHEEGEDNRDFWDITAAGEGSEYVARVMREAEERGL